MKKLIILFCMIITAGFLKAQSQSVIPSNIINSAQNVYPSFMLGHENDFVKTIQNKGSGTNKIATTTCLDTIYYPHSKMTAFDGFVLLNSSATFRTGLSQTYNANTGLVHGIDAIVLLDTNGIVGDAAPLDVYIKVVNVDNLNRPTTTIDSTLVTVTDVGLVSQTLLFTNPIPVSGRYAITLELNPATMAVNNDSLWYVTNSSTATPPDGKSEGLFAIQFTGGSWINLFLEIANQRDVDVLLAPIFEKTITAAYTTDVDSTCLGGSVVFTNTAALDTNYMYNLYDSLNTDPWIWSYNDGTGTYNHYDTTYTFASGGTYNTQLLITNYGYTANCVDSIQKTIEVIDLNVTANSDTIICTGDPVTLSVTGSASLYTWDNGLGTGTTQTITPTIDTLYKVVGTDAFGCVDTDSVFVAIAPCNCVDTIYYPHSKMTAFDGFVLLNSSATFRVGLSQTYNANTGFVHGIDAVVLLDTNGIIGDAAPLDVYIKVVNVDNLNRPTTTIDSNIVTITDVGTVSQTLLFTQPVPVSGRYAVVLTLDPATMAVNNDSLFYVTNSSTATPPDGQSEGLFAVQFTGGTWINLFLQFVGQKDVDVLLAPIFDKTITADYTTDVDSLCLGDDVVFTNTSILDTNYMYNRWDSLGTDLYEWNYDDGTGTYNHVDTTYTFAAAGSYNTQLLITNYGYTGNCVDSLQKTIEVLETVVVASTDTAICIGDTVNLSATGAATYNWDNGLGAGQNQTAAPIVDTMYVVTGTGSVGTFACVDTDTVNVTINALPIVVASNDTTICSADTVFLSVTGANTYNWDNGLGAGQNQFANPLSDTIYVVTGTDTLGCINTDTVSVLTLTLPVIIASNDTTICNGDTVTVSAVGAVTYDWDNSLGAGQSQIVTPNLTTNYVVTGIDGNGCSNLDTAIVTVNALPILTTTPDTAICTGDSITLTVSGALTYTWDNGLGAGATQLIISPLDTVYSVIGIDANGCANQDSVDVTINAIPMVVASNDTTICLGTSTNLTVTGATSYDWDNGLGSGDFHEVMPDVSTTYIVSGDENGCIGSDTVVVKVDNMCFEIPNVFTPNGDGKNDFWNIKGLEIYPNVVVKVLNRWGDLMFESSVGYLEPWDGTYNGTASPSATYYYIIALGDGEETVTGTINIIR